MIVGLQLDQSLQLFRVLINYLVYKMWKNGGKCSFLFPIIQSDISKLKFI